MPASYPESPIAATVATIASLVIMLGPPGMLIAFGLAIAGGGRRLLWSFCCVPLVLAFGWLMQALVAGNRQGLAVDALGIAALIAFPMASLLIAARLRSNRPSGTAVARSP